MSKIVPILYKMDMSPPCRAVYMAAKALNITLNMKEVNLFSKEQYAPNFLKMNPQHTIPTLDDNGTIVNDSHVISTYLVRKFGQNDSLYPKDLKRRTIVDQRLYFDSTIYPLIGESVISIERPMTQQNEKLIPDEKEEKIHDTYTILEKLLTGEKWSAGETATVADFCLISSISTMDLVVPVTEEKYPNVTAWINRCQSCSWYGENRKGLEECKQIIELLSSVA